MLPDVVPVEDEVPVPLEVPLVEPVYVFPDVVPVLVAEPVDEVPDVVPDVVVEPVDVVPVLGVEPVVVDVVPPDVVVPEFEPLLDVPLVGEVLPLVAPLGVVLVPLFDVPEVDVVDDTGV